MAANDISGRGHRNQDLTGLVFGRLTVRGIGNPRVINGLVVWDCECVCGGGKTLAGTLLKRGRVLSCGCLNKEITAARNHRHGKTFTPEYETWCAIKRRCYSPKSQYFRLYGGKGIKVCERWLESFENFFADMGPRPSGKQSIDRIDGEKGYSPDNCRWATSAEQSRNKNNNHWLEIDGRRMIVQDWSKESGIGYCTIIMRIKAGWPTKLAVFAPKSARLRNLLKVV